jgi:hypothetical protein
MIFKFQPTRLAKGKDSSRYLALESMKTRFHNMPAYTTMSIRNCRYTQTYCSVNLTANNNHFLAVKLCNY